MTIRATRHSFHVALCLLIGLLSNAELKANEASYVRFQVPGAMGTYPMSVNNSMAVTGYYYASPTLTRGFVRQADGTYSTFDAVGSSWTEPEGINDAGEVTGYYLAYAAEFGGLEPESFIRYADGRIITFNSTCNTECGLSAAFSINAFGEVAGSYLYNNSTLSGFARTRDGSFNSYLLQFATNPYGAVATAINGSGIVAGFYEPSEFGSVESFIVDARGYVTDGIYVPSPNTTAPYTFEITVAEGINAEGAIAGWYFGCNTPCPATLPPPGAFVRSPEGAITIFTPPGTLVTTPQADLSFAGGEATFLESLRLAAEPHWLSINQPGSITGSYTDAAGAQHGFVRNPYGTITSFDPPKGHQTTATSINDSGVIAGTYLYVGSNPASVGFLRIPQPQP